MMAITLGEILEHVEQFEQLLRDFYANLSQETTHEGVRLLTDYMSRHSLRIHELLEKLPLDERKTICSTPIPYMPEFPGKKSIKLAKLPSDPTASQVLDAAVSFDDCLVKMYQSVAEQPVSQEIKDFFGYLIRDMETDEIQLKKIKAMDYF
jgi:ferritin-like protein